MLPSNESRTQCQFCAATFSRPRSAVAHAMHAHMVSHVFSRIKIETKIWKPISNNILDSAPIRQIHYFKDQVKDTWFRCEECDHLGPTEQSISFHKSKIHGKGSTNIACEFCPQSFSSSKKYSEHAGKVSIFHQFLMPSEILR